MFTEIAVFYSAMALLALIGNYAWHKHHDKPKLGGILRHIERFTG